MEDNQGTENPVGKNARESDLRASARLFSGMVRNQCRGDVDVKPLPPVLIPFIRAQNNKSFVCLVPRVPTSLFMMTVSRALYASCWQICMARSPSREVFSSSVFFAQSCGQMMIMVTKLRIPASLIPFLYFLLSYDISVKCALASPDFLPKRL